MAAPEEPGLRPALRTWFQPPRPHGTVVDGRVVSPLELFYDLVFVVFVSEVAHALAAHPDATGVRSFVVLFTVLWFAWFNGTSYQDLHGSDDGRSRTYMFVQMGFVSLLAVYAGHAPDRAHDGRVFGGLLAAFIAWMAYQWWVVRQQDDPESAAITTPYFAGLAAIFAAAVASAFVASNDLRVLLWATGAALAIVLPMFARLGDHQAALDRAFQLSSSMVERFGLLTIIVLGEVIVGIVGGLSSAEHTTATTTVGLLCLLVSFGIWWTYFDFAGQRPPRPRTSTRVLWLVTHLPLTMAVAATGAGMVSLIEHAGEERTPAGTSWLVGGAVAVLCLSEAALMRLTERRPGVRLVPAGLVLAAAVALLAAALRPEPWLLATVLVGALTAVWVESFVRHARLGQQFLEEG
ncbi:MAG: low temperature requirement protein A [Nocardioidaceae bacterium]|nr:low temperature requirement protein A [Nocardioidaceae bacterium]